ncbi:MAG: DUF4340 domain-containing protein [Verrucomicrobiota bacterium]|nr:DUF4340 domain-containing protein [Verrucomicrobiota bacterium]
MKTKTTLVLLAVVVALGVWIKFFESKGPNTEEAKRRSGNVVNFDRAKLDGIVIQNGDDKIELRKSNETWRLEAPIKDQADRSIVDNLISDLESWEKDDAFSEKEMQAEKNRLEEYDLAKPKLRLKLLGKEMPREILFGKDAALEGKMYVRFDNSKETFVVRQTVKKDIAKKPEDFRDRKLTELSAAQVARILLKTSAGEMELQKKNDAWEIVKPLHARADSQKVGDLIAQVTSARIAQFVAEDKGDLQPYGLAEARGAITLFRADEKEGQMLQIGALSTKENEKDQVYVRFSPRSFVYTVPKKIEDVLKIMPADLRDRHLVRIDENNLDRITIDAPGKGKVVLARKEQNWVIASKNNQAANTAEVNRVLELLKNEQVTKFVEDVASDLPKYGLDKPQLQITFSSFASENTAESQAGEHPFATLAIGKLEGETVYARVGEEPFIVAVRKQFSELIPTDPVLWQDLSIFKFKPDEVHRLSVTTDKEETLIRGPNKEWTWAQGSGPINQTNVQSLLNTLTNLRAVRWNPGPPPPQAFEKPQVTISFTTSPDDKTTHKLTVGGAAGEGMWFAKVDGRDGVFVMNNPDFNALRLSVAESATPSPSPAPSPAATP